MNPATVVRIGRAIMSAIQPLTGERAVGQLRMQAKPGETALVPQYTYFTPRISGDNHPSWYFKTGRSSADDGVWTVDDSGDVLVDVYSNLGGVRFNLAKDTPFVPELPIEGLDLQLPPRANEDFTGGQDPIDQVGALRDVSFYESFDGPALSKDIERSQLRYFPALLLAFDEFMPADGVSIAQVNQAAVSAGAGTRLFKVGYSLSIIVSREHSEHIRRHEGLLIADQIMAELNAREAAPDGETISQPSGLMLRQLIRETGPQELYQKFFVYTLFVSAMVAIERTERRKYAPWLRTVMDVQRRPDAVPASTAQQEAFTLVDNMIIDMTPKRLDLALDGVFTRGSTATLFRESRLHSYVAHGRRTLDSEVGVYLEPQVGNALGNAAQDFALWTLGNGALLASDAISDPTEVGLADIVTFPAGVLVPSISLAAQPASTGQAIVYSIFARAVTSTGKTRLKLGLFDGLSEIISGEYDLDSNWRRIRWKVTPQSNLVTLRVVRQSSGSGQQIALWGAAFDTTRVWGPEYTYTTKLKDQLRFGKLPTGAQDSQLDTPVEVFRGKWTLVWSNDVVPCTLVGTGLGTTKLASLGNGVLADLFTLELVGTPGSGGAMLVARTRGAGVVITLNGLTWKLATKLSFTVDSKGMLTVKGTDAHDGDYPFARYDLDADLTTDYLVIGDNAAGTSNPTPGFFAVVDVGP